jgi:glycosyltransferase involved in cell wall biosynthesis
MYLIITPFFPDHSNFRGPFILDQVQAIKKTEQLDVVVFKPKKLYSKEKDYEIEGVNVYRFRSFELPSNILPGLFDFFSKLSLKIKLNNLGIDINQIKVAHSHVTGLGIYPNYLKKKNHAIKSILQHHGFDVLSLENGRLRNIKWHRIWVKNYGIKICNDIDLHVGVSAKTLEFLESIDNIKINNKYILYNGIDTSKFYPIQGLKNKSVFTIGCIANFWPLKDQITLLKATKILVDNGVTDLFVKFIGTGETLMLCLDFVKENKLEKFIEFKDSIPHDKLVFFYNSLDLFVLPSYHEAFGCVYTEAHACGVPFIAVEAQGIAELIPEKDQYNWIVKKEDFKGLAAKIEDFRTHKYKQFLNESIDITYFINKFLIHINKQ